MPCSWYRRDESHGTLVMHMARGNQQWKSIAEGARGLAIIHGPQAYVTPSWYESKVEHGKVVPTWNYTAVHLSGSVAVSHDQDHLRSIVSDLTDLHEAGRSTPWAVADAPEEYLAGQLKAIVAVTLHVDRIQAKAKLSQNREARDRLNAADTLLAKGAEGLGKAMREAGKE